MEEEDKEVRPLLFHCCPFWYRVLNFRNLRLRVAFSRNIQRFISSKINQMSSMNPIILWSSEMLRKKKKQETRTINLWCLLTRYYFSLWNAEKTRLVQEGRWRREEGKGRWWGRFWGRGLERPTPSSSTRQTPSSTLSLSLSLSDSLSCNPVSLYPPSHSTSPLYARNGNIFIVYHPIRKKIKQNTPPKKNKDKTMINIGSLSLSLPPSLSLLSSLLAFAINS